MNFTWSFWDGPGTWENKSVLIAMIIYSIFLSVFTSSWIHKYFKGSRKKVKIGSMLLVYLLSAWFITILAQIIENFVLNRFSDGYCGLHLFWGENKDILITIFAPLIPPILIGIISLVHLKKRSRIETDLQSQGRPPVAPTNII